MTLNISRKLSCILILFALLTPVVVFGVNGNNFEDFSGLDNTAKDSYDLTKNSIPVTIGNVIAYALSLLGVILLCIIIISFFIMQSAGGDEEKVKTAKAWLKNGIIAVIILMGAYLVTMIFIYFFSGGIFNPSGGS